MEAVTFTSRGFPLLEVVLDDDGQAVEMVERDEDGEEIRRWEAVETSAPELSRPSTSTVVRDMNGQVERASTVAEAKHIVDMANTAVEACKLTRQSIAETNTYAELALRATIKAG